MRRRFDPDYFEDLLRQVTREADPWPDPEPTPRRSAADLWEIASQRRRKRGLIGRCRSRLAGLLLAQPRRHRILTRTLVISFTVVLAVAIGTSLAVRSRISPPHTYGAPGTLKLQFPDDAPPARARLHQLADAANNAADTIPTGTYTHVRTQTWSADPTSTDGSSTVTAVEENLFWAADHSGVRTTLALPPEPAGQTTAGYVEQPPPSIGDLQRFVYGPHELTVIVDRPSNQPEILAGQMHAENPARTPQALVRTAADLYRFHALTPRQRAAVLQVLADTDGLVDRGQVTDRAGRPGVAISVDGSESGVQVRDILIFDPVTGALLSHEQLLLTRPTLAEALTPSVAAYVLYLTNSRVDTLPGL